MYDIINYSLLMPNLMAFYAKLNEKHVLKLKKKSILIGNLSYGESTAIYSTPDIWLVVRFGFIMAL